MFLTGDNMLLLKCDILATGPGPSEKVVGIKTTDGDEEIVLHTSALVNQDKFEVGVHRVMKRTAH